jgi:hypothetical protein
VNSDPPWLADLRNKVKARLRAQGATQVGLAWHLGITPKHMSQLLTGTVTGTPEMLDRLAAQETARGRARIRHDRRCAARRPG